MLRFLLLSFVLAGCPGGGGSTPAPDAAPVTPDAPPTSPPDAPLRGFGQSCTAANQCAGGLCIGETAGSFVCSMPCDIDVAHACRDVDAFCVPVSGGEHGCYGTIETGTDLDDAILSVGDSVTRAVTPLGDADLFQVRLDQLGTIQFKVTPAATIDVQLEAYDVLGAPIGTANANAGGGVEALVTDVQQLGSHLFFVVRNVGTSTGSYTFTATKVTGGFAPGLPAEASTLERR